jgi:hypothetical protein
MSGQYILVVSYNGRIIGELEILSNEAIMPYSRYYSGIILERLKQTTMTWTK